MLNKKEYIMLELVKLDGSATPIDFKAVEGVAEWILEKGEEYQLQLEEAEQEQDNLNGEL